MSNENFALEFAKTAVESAVKETSCFQESDKGSGANDTT
jgi:hypothetical protein